MSRGRTGTQLAADTAPHRGGAVLVELLFASGTLRLALARWDVQVGADLYVHTGAALAMDEHDEAADGAEGLRFTLSGLEAGIFNLIVNEPYRGRLMRVLEQRYNADDTQADAASVEFIGRMVAMSSSEQPQDRSHTVVLDVEHFDADGRRPANLRYSDAEQRRRYPDDKGAEYVASMVERVMTRSPL